MKKLSPAPASSGLRQRLIEDMTVREFSEKTRRYYIRIVAGFAAFLGRSLATATAEGVRRFQVHQSSLRMPGLLHL
jgi:integrase/recombinase XerD